MMVRSLRISDAQSKAIVLWMYNIGVSAGYLEDQINRTIVNTGVFGKLHAGVWRRDVGVFQILGGDRDGNILVF